MRAHFFPAIQRSLTAKLVIAVSGVIVLNSILLWYMIIYKEQARLMEEALHSTSASSEIMKMSIRHDMLHGRMQDLQEVLEAIEVTQKVERVRLLDLKGRIAHSSAREEIGRVLSKETPECRICHDTAKPLASFHEKPRWTVMGNDGSRTLTYVDPIYNEPECFTSACHAHPPERKVLGLLTTNYSLSRYDAQIRAQILNTTVSTLFFVGVIALLLSFILWEIVLKPVRALTEAMKQVSTGTMVRKVEVTSLDEIGRLAGNFNEMTDEVHASRRKMEQWTQALEDEVEKKTAEIRNTRDKLIQSEKLAALGRMTADIAHQIRNPLAALGGFGRRLKKLATSEKQEAYAEIVASEAERLERILRDVLIFSWDTQVVMRRLPLREVVKESLEFFHEICREQAIEVQFHSETDLALLMDRNHLGQAINNIVANAIDVMPAGGVLAVTVCEEQFYQITWGVVRITDTGPGVPGELLARIVEPFYTTKRGGQGTGLGLPISKKIVEEHGGFIRIENRQEGGLCVSSFFPWQTEEDSAREPCWRYMQCGQESNSQFKCPAYPYFGRVCWAVAGTHCDGIVQGAFAQKIKNCRACAFYREINEKK